MPPSNTIKDTLLKKKKALPKATLDSWHIASQLFLLYLQNPSYTTPGIFPLFLTFLHFLCTFLDGLPRSEAASKVSKSPKLELFGTAFNLPLRHHRITVVTSTKPRDLQELLLGEATESTFQDHKDV